MESEAKYTLVGSIVVGIVALVCLFAVWLSNNGQGSYEYYKIYFKNQNLAGLQTDSDVTMKGIKVGSVDSYGISPNNVEQVEVLIRVNMNTPVKVDTRAVINRNILTGLAQIELTKGTQLSELLTKISKDEKYPIILEGRTELAQLADNVPELLGTLTDLSSRVNSVFSDENVKSITGILNNLEQVSVTIKKSDKNIEAIISNLAKLTGNLEQSTDKFNKLADKADQRLNVTGTELNQAIKDIAEAARTVSKSVESTSQVVSIETQQISHSLNSASESIAAVAEKFENPKAIITGPSKDNLGPGEVILGK